MEAEKKAVQDFWERASCGEELYLPNADADSYLDQARRRYELEPYIETFADFAGCAGKRVLEIGVGLGADHQRFAQAGAQLWGIDLTERAVAHTRRRVKQLQLHSKLCVADAENLPFGKDAFDVVYSWGVIHHSPNTAQAVAEIHRVLRPGGSARVMVYNRASLVGYMLWMRYALARLKPWTSLAQIYARCLESPGTKAYTIAEATSMFSIFKSVEVQIVLTHGDLLESQAGQRHRGPLLALARQLWPRAFLRRVARAHGLFMLISAKK